MISTVYTYKDQKVALFQKPKFYYLSNENELEKLIDNLLDIDAVSSPAELTFPCVLKLKTGFAPNLELSSLKEYRSELKSQRALLDKQTQFLKSLK